ncbi:MAG: hypothetical protein KDD62_07875, partial [Bdellovibrionales bacterium]|nr:hypothetical protein [Bdellovibrionales bacterium]
QAAQYKAYLDDINNLQAQLEPQLVTVVSNPSKDELLAVSNSLHALGVAEGQVLRFEYGFSTLSNLWRLMFDGLFVSLSTAMFSLLGVYIASAAYRAFRIRSFEAVLMMTAAVLVMLGQIPFGVYIYSGMPEIRDWILRVPNSAAFRAITIGTGIAGLVMAFRMWFSIESDFGSEEG